MAATYSGCVYHAPNKNEYSPVNVEDLNAKELKEMKLVGLPIRAAHGKYVGDDIGVITDEWSGKDGSKHISFQISEAPQYAAYREGVSQRWYTHLSLGHDVDAKRGMVPREVSICHLGARKNTIIAKPEMTAAEYKALTTGRKTEAATMADSTPAAAAATMDTQPDAPAQDVSPEEQALDAIRSLDQDKQEIIAKGWTSTSQRLEQLSGRLSETQKELEEARSRLDQSTKENETLKIATKETAAHLVFSRARFI